MAEPAINMMSMALRLATAVRDTPTNGNMTVPTPSARTIHPRPPLISPPLVLMGPNWGMFCVSGIPAMRKGPGSGKKPKKILSLRLVHKLGAGQSWFQSTCGTGSPTGPLPMEFDGATFIRAISLLRSMENHGSRNPTRTSAAPATSNLLPPVIGVDRAAPARALSARAFRSLTGDLIHCCECGLRAGSTKGISGGMTGPSAKNKAARRRFHVNGPLEYKAGNVLLSHPVARAVPWALVGLTTVFGMGTGVAPPLKSPAKSWQRAGAHHRNW